MSVTLLESAYAPIVYLGHKQLTKEDKECAKRITEHIQSSSLKGRKQQIKNNDGLYSIRNSITKMI